MMFGLFGMRPPSKPPYTPPQITPLTPQELAAHRQQLAQAMFNHQAGGVIPVPQGMTPGQVAISAMQAALQSVNSFSFATGGLGISQGSLASIPIPMPDPDVPDTFGWRGWFVSGDKLMSPHFSVVWDDSELRAEEWNDDAAVRGVAGIHALRVPHNWKLLDPAHTEIGAMPVHGIVERFGRFVLGTMGWRAEWVVIRELVARDADIARALKRSYPDVKVYLTKLVSEEVGDENRSDQEGGCTRDRDAGLAEPGA